MKIILKHVYSYIISLTGSIYRSSNKQKGKKITKYLIIFYYLNYFIKNILAPIHCEHYRGKFLQDVNLLH